MSPKNAKKKKRKKKEVNIQKYYLVHIGRFRSTLVHSAHFGSIQSKLVLFRPICPLGPI